MFSLHAMYIADFHMKFTTKYSIKMSLGYIKILFKLCARSHKFTYKSNQSWKNALARRFSNMSNPRDRRMHGTAYCNGPDGCLAYLGRMLSDVPLANIYHLSICIGKNIYKTINTTIVQ